MEGAGPIISFFNRTVKDFISYNNNGTMVVDVVLAKNFGENFFTDNQTHCHSAHDFVLLYGQQAESSGLVDRVRTEATGSSGLWAIAP